MEGREFSDPVRDEENNYLVTSITNNDTYATYVIERDFYT
jgi:hypothetical protein